jgi:hypothetical protein
MNLNEIDQLARKVMRRHGLESWRLIYDDTPGALAVCHYNIGVITMRSDVVARGLYTEIMGTLLHEIAHGLTPGHSHDAVWHSRFVELIRLHTFGC